MSKFVPYLSDEKIERDSEALLAEFSSERNVVIAPPIPIEDIVEKHLKLGIEFDDTHRLFGVPRSGRGLGQGPDILGAIFLNERRIVIDESLDPDENPSMEGRFRFTLGHEGGGHWRLHRRLLAKDPAQIALFGGPAVPSVVCRSSQSRERVELQADLYAAYLLMPRKLVFDAWQKEFGTYEPFIFDATKRASAASRPRGNGPRMIGAILREMIEPDHTYVFDLIAKKFAPVFRVSPIAMRIRLENLGLLCREIPRQKGLAGLAWRRIFMKSMFSVN
jgi:hypothetical protein